MTFFFAGLLDGRFFILKLALSIPELGITSVVFVKLEKLRNISLSEVF